LKYRYAVVTMKILIGRSIRVVLEFFVFLKINLVKTLIFP